MRQENLSSFSIERLELEQESSLYGRKFALQRLFVESGLSGVETILLTPNATDSNVEEAVNKVFSVGTGATIRFSYGTELNLPRGFFDNAEDCLQFIADNRGEYALIIQEYTRLVNSFELYIDDDRTHLQVMPGIWEVDSGASPDIIDIIDGQTRIHRYKQSRSAKYLDDRRNFVHEDVSPYSMDELQDFLDEIENLRPRLEDVRKLYNPLFCHFIRDDKGQLTFLNVRDTSGIDFSLSEQEDLFIVKRPEDISTWNRESPILFDVQSEREDDTPILETISRVKDAGVESVFITYGALSHPAILLREAGLKVQQSLSDYDSKILLEEDDSGEDELNLSIEVSRYILSLDAINEDNQPSNTHTLKIEDLSNDSISFGGKAKNLAILSQNGFNVPHGFVVSTEIDESLSNPQTLEALQEIISQYEAMGSPIVAVRSSATVEDMDESSSAGIYTTTLNVHGREQLVAALIKGFRSNHSDSAVEYRSKNSMPLGDMKLIVQEMVDADAAGVIFSTVTQDENESVVINAIKGIGEPLVSGRLMGDLFRLENGEVLEEVINPQDYILTRTGTYPTSAENRLSRSLTRQQVEELAKVAKDIESLYGSPQDIEFAIRRGKIWVLQTRPITA